MNALYSALFLLLTFGNCLAVPAEKTVQTKYGTFIVTTEDVTFKGVTRRFTEFLGIPYAEAPTGNLRFRKPTPKSPLTTVYNATYMRPSCPQALMIDFPGIHYDEDCLHVNVYVPETDAMSSANRLPVMIYIHGGSFVFGGSNLYVPDVLCTVGDVIVVLVSYRLSVFGFLSTSDEVSPGNYGLWDQHLAIKWVHDNIDDFGGDPARVTIFGTSAGSASVSYQALFPGNIGLFQHAVAESGGPECHWAFNKNPDPSRYASVVGCDATTSHELVQCLRSKPAEELMTKLNEPPVPWHFYGFSPTKDGHFIKKDPCELMASESISSEELETLASIDLLAGLTNGEGGFHGFWTWPNVLDIKDWESYNVTRAQFKDIVIPFVLEKLFMDTSNDAMKKSLLYQYTDWTDPDNTLTIRDMLIQLSGDFAFVYPTINLADLHSKTLKQKSKLNTFFYQFSGRPSQCIYTLVPTWFNGNAHGEDLEFRFGLSDRDLERKAALGRVQLSAADFDFAETTITMWTNFAKTGNPNHPVPIPTPWPNYTASGREYLDITKDMSEKSSKRRFGEPWLSFWLEFVLPSFMKCSSEQPQNIHEHIEL